MQVTHLRCNYLVRPLAVPAQEVRLSWQSKPDGSKVAPSPNFKVQIREAGAEGFIVDSPAIGLSMMARLKPETAYQWRVRHETGRWTGWEPFTTALSAWPVPFIADSRPVADPVMAHNGWHSQVTKDGSEQKWVQIELPAASDIDSVTLWPARPIDWIRDAPGFFFPIRIRVEVDGVVVHESASDLPASTEPVKVTFAKRSAKTIRVTATQLRPRAEAEYGFCLAELEASLGDEVRSRGAVASAKDSLENRVWSLKNLTNGDRFSHGVQNIDALPAVEYRSERTLKDVPKSAILYLTALGAYQARINGKPVGPNHLAPEWTDYNSRLQYQAYDVAKLLKPGKNEIRVLVGDGWYAGRLGMAQALDPRGFPRAVYGRKTALSGFLRIEGLPDWVADSSWESANDGPVRSSDMLDGEVFDATRSASNWAPVMLHGSPKGMRIVPQPNEPIAVTQEVKPVSLVKLGDKWIADFGQNLVGHLRLSISGPKGTEVVIRHAEVLNEDGTIYTDNLRGAPQIDHLILGGGETVWEPHFTYHGFRFAEVSAPGCGQPKLLARVFHSSSPEGSSFDCSDPMVNRLWQNVVWTTRANMMSVPTDCPQRDERLGWTGDILSFCQTGFYVMDLSAFCGKWLADMRDSQADDGRYPDFAPHPYGKNDRFNGVPGWGDAAVGVAWDHWVNTGDTRVIAEHLTSMERYLAWLEEKNPNHLWLNERHNDYGDWLNGDTVIREGWPRKGGECPKDVFATLMWYLSAKQVRQMAAAVGTVSPRVQAMPELIAAAFNKAYVDKDIRIKGDTQAGYALALDFGILDKSAQPKAFDHMVEAIERVDRHITTGFHSTHRMMRVLVQRGRSDLAYTLLLNRTFPSWGYTIDQGATTIWERWDGYVKGRGFQDKGMNSFNHWALGSVGQWMMETVVGVNGQTLSPVPDPRLTHGGGSYEAPFGRVDSHWTLKNGKFVWKISLPAVPIIVVPPGANVKLDGQAVSGPLKLSNGTFVITSDYAQPR